MAQFSTGMAHVFLQPPSTQPYFGSGNTANAGSQAPQYFGSCEGMPQDQRQPEYEMLMNDASGSKVPLDVSWQGESAQISLVMTRTNQVLAEALLASPRPFVSQNSPVSPPGSWSFNDMGALIGLEGLGWTCWIVYQFGAALGNKGAYVGQGLRPGRRYLQCILWAPQSEEVGTKPMKQHFMLFAWPYADFKNKRFVLYDYNMNGINLNAIN